MSRNLISYFSALKVYTHLPCTVDRGEASILSSGNTSTKEKSLCQTVNIEKKLRARWRYVTKLLRCPLKDSKKNSTAKELIIEYNVVQFSHCAN